jgi:hypothetical protein
MEEYTILRENIKALKGYYRYLLSKRLRKNILEEEERILSFFIDRLKKYKSLYIIIGRGASITKYIRKIKPEIDFLGGTTYQKYAMPIYLDSEKLCAEIFKKEAEVYNEEKGV